VTSGIKELTTENWEDHDPANGAFGKTNLLTGEQHPMSADDWARQFLAVELSDGVPDDVRTMWAAARGILVYGVFYYPLYALGDEQLHRVADAAVVHRYEQLGGQRDPKGRWPSLQVRLDWLVSRGAIDREVERRWDAIRDLRNYGSHATFQRLCMPMDAFRTLEILRDEIEALFDAGEETPAP
jgi:hypothetical protein